MAGQTSIEGAPDHGLGFISDAARLNCQETQEINPAGALIEGMLGRHQEGVVRIYDVDPHRKIDFSRPRD